MLKPISAFLLTIVTAQASFAGLDKIDQGTIKGVSCVDVKTGAVAPVNFQTVATWEFGWPSQDYTVKLGTTSIYMAFSSNGLTLSADGPDNIYQVLQWNTPTNDLGLMGPQYKCAIDIEK